MEWNVFCVEKFFFFFFLNKINGILCVASTSSHHTHTHFIFETDIISLVSHMRYWFNRLEILERCSSNIFARSSPKCIIHSMHTKSQLISLCIREMCVPVYAIPAYQPNNNFARTVQKREDIFTCSVWLAEQEVKKKKWLEN